MKKWSTVHETEMVKGSRVPWIEPEPPDVAKGVQRWTGRLHHCAWCGSMHPSDVLAALQDGAKLEWADFKYGWPHKVYLHDVPNPHAGLLEIRASGTYQAHPDWVQDEEGWHEPPAPASNKTWGKFYTVHLQDATPEERSLIEKEMGFTFVFEPDGGVRWKELAP